MQPLEPLLPVFEQVRAIERVDASRSPRTQRHPKDSALLEALTVIAHDLKGPLANLSILIELIDAYVKVQAHDRASISTAKAMGLIDALDDMLSGFLRRTRETGDPLSFEPALVDLSEVVARAVDLNRPIAESRSVCFNLAAVQRLTVDGDKALLIEAIENLISNSAKHTPSGTTIRCSAIREGRDVIFTVDDEGSGLSERQLQHAFQPFARTPSRKTAGRTSWGLGLWIVRLIAERHGGRVEVCAKADTVGATVRFCLPARLR